MIALTKFSTEWRLRIYQWHSRWFFRYGSHYISLVRFIGWRSVWLGANAKCNIDWKVELNLWHVWIAVKMTMLKGTITKWFSLSVWMVAMVWVENARIKKPLSVQANNLKWLCFMGDLCFYKTDFPRCRRPAFCFALLERRFVTFLDLHSGKLHVKFIVNQFKIYEQNYFVCIVDAFWMVIV